MLKIRKFVLPIIVLIFLAYPVNGQVEYYHFDSKLAEKLMFSALNSIRFESRLQLFSRDTNLARVANRHTRDMIKRNFFSHENPDGDSPRERVKSDKIPYPVSENLGILSSYGLEVNDVVEELLRSLMESPEHRANILNPDLSEIGISFAQDRDEITDIIDMDVIGDSKLGYGTIIVCQLFMKKGLLELYPDPFPEIVQKGDSITISAEAYKSFDTVTIELQEVDGGRMIRSSEIVLFENSFSEIIRFHRTGKFDLRIMGIKYLDENEPEIDELATFLIEVQDQ